MGRNFLVSSDITGIMGRRSDWEYIWGIVLKDPSFSGFEMIGWKWGSSFIGPKYNFRVAGIHGQTAGWNEGRDLFGKVTLSLLNYLFFSIDELISASAETEYMLLHRGVLNRTYKQILISQKEKIKLVLIENDLVPSSLEKTIKLITELRENGVNAGLMFDLVHFLREPHQDSPNLKRWDLLLTALSDVSNYEFPMSCHFPIGEYANDSLPLSTFTSQMWTDLSAAMKKVPFRYIVLENQAPRRYSLVLSKVDKLYFRKRTEEVYLTLKKHGII